MGRKIDFYCDVPDFEPTGTFFPCMMMKPFHSLVPEGHTRLKITVAFPDTVLKDGTECVAEAVESVAEPVEPTATPEKAMGTW